MSTIRTFQVSTHDVFWIPFGITMRTCISFKAYTHTAFTFPSCKHRIIVVRTKVPAILIRFTRGSSMNHCCCIACTPNLVTRWASPSLVTLTCVCCWNTNTSNTIPTVFILLTGGSSTGLLITQCT